MSETTEAHREAAQRFSELERNSQLSAIQAGVTGQGAEFCIDCDEPIEEKRRKVAPFARRCVDCQEMKETSHGR